MNKQTENIEIFIVYRKDPTNSKQFMSIQTRTEYTRKKLSKNDSELVDESKKNETIAIGRQS